MHGGGHCQQRSRKILFRVLSPVGRPLPGAWPHLANRSYPRPTSLHLGRYLLRLVTSPCDAPGPRLRPRPAHHGLVRDVNLVHGDSGSRTAAVPNAVAGHVVSRRRGDEQSLLRRHRNHREPPTQQQWLATATVVWAAVLSPPPGAEGQLLALATAAWSATTSPDFECFQLRCRTLEESKKKRGQ